MILASSPRSSPRKSVKSVENLPAHEARPEPPTAPSRSPRWSAPDLPSSSASSTDPGSPTAMLHSSRRPPKTDAERHSWYKPAPASPKVPPRPVLEQTQAANAASAPSSKHQTETARRHHMSDGSRYPQTQQPSRIPQYAQHPEHQHSSQPHLQQGSQHIQFQQIPQRQDHQPYQQHQKAKSSLGGHQAGPVQGRPLIFAAMTAADFDAPGIVSGDGQVGVDVPDLAAAGLGALISVGPGDEEPRQAQSGFNSAFVDGYPTPKSPSPPLPPEKHAEAPAYPVTTRQLQMHAQTQPWPVEAAGGEQTRAQVLQQPPGDVQTPRERKLSRTRGHVDRQRDAEAAQADGKPATVHMEAPPPGTSTRRSRPLPPSPADASASSSPSPPPHSPPQPMRAAAPPPAPLGSPFQPQSAPPRPPAHARPHRHSRDGVKVLTGRQLEKLANRAVATTPGAPRTGAEDPPHAPCGPLPSPPSAPRSPPAASPAATPPVVTPPAEERPPTRARTNSRHRRASLPAVPPPTPPTPVSADEAPPRARVVSQTASGNQAEREDRDDVPRAIQAAPPVQPPTPISPEEYARARAQRRGARPEKARPLPVEPEPQSAAGEEVVEREPTYYPLAKHLVHPGLLAGVLPYLSFHDWCAVAAVSKKVRKKLAGDRELCEMVLERYLRTVGYARWAWAEPDPLTLSLEARTVRMSCWRCAEPNAI
ncbi:hypothetical protein OBBRIDRAFT_663246 [Obba rivulosa]|uniref:F-box domain-containing protein n=1 Tax=Obba rivulosa TaxID=1052685 RepID=A0A8E2AW79_9APHY|nr:hypothetical protein OBBRIDRAFT_663246 [Obba rivulosa]